MQPPPNVPSASVEPTEDQESELQYDDFFYKEPPTTQVLLHVWFIVVSLVYYCLASLCKQVTMHYEDWDDLPFSQLAQVDRQAPLSEHVGDSQLPLF